MKEVSIEALTPGMTLGRSISSPDGKIVLSQGTVITEFWLTRIKQWNLGTVMVTEQTGQEEISEAELAHLLQQAGTV
ncbi:hypothetical protein [Acetonema longum]|uniref:Uncharacterized protein n=1 Tax=Acetonema longum DSM 6540 TaxID=1009370 RepID=F7NG85_9FIRM|nr:hypothetical protein [Acetonema longum]EGO65003.1 hypothetical protein ALO_05358 [Acetonema longum DSM 6540]